jgi:signal peptidase
VRTFARRLLAASRVAVLATVLAGVIVLAAGHLLGWSALIVRSGSMEPSVPVGSLVLARPVQPADVQLRDVVAVPRQIGGRQVLVLHRVVALTEHDGRRLARLRGDANPVPDPEPVVLAGPVARSVVVVPAAGYVVAAVRMALSPSRALVVLAGVLGLILIWRRPRPLITGEPGINGRGSRREVEYAGRVRQNFLLRRPR